MHTIPGLHLLSMIGAVFMAITVTLVRLRAARKPVTERSILIPPLGMSTGFGMFLVPAVHIPWMWGIEAFLAGALLFAYPLIRSSRFQIINGSIYLQRSKSFIVILVVLLAIRLTLHTYIEQYVSLPQTGAIFFLLAFGMILPWRTAMYLQYRSKLKELRFDNRSCE